MGKKGSAAIYGLMLGLVIVILALGIAPAVYQGIDSARNNSYNSSLTYIDAQGNTVTGNITHEGLDCTNTSIDNFHKATCIASDLSGFYFILILIFIGGAIVTAKIYFQ